MRIDDKDIDKLLEGFESKDIEIPTNLERKLNKKLIELKPKNSDKYKFIKLAMVGALVLLVSYSIIPPFRSFANDMFKYIFGDIGIENAINNGYEKVEGQSVKIDKYDIEIDNIYVDDLRISFDAVIKNPADIDKPKNYNEHYTLFANNRKFKDTSWSCSPFDYNEESEYKSNVQLMGEGIGKLLEDKPKKISLDLELTKTYSVIENNKKVYKDEIVGSSTIEIIMPSNIYDRKEIEINKTVSDENIDLNINSLSISPTMMYLNTNGANKEGDMINGLYNLKVISEKNKVYSENLSLWGSGNKDSYKQTIVPSMYYDKSKYINIVADGVNVTPRYKDIEIRIDDSYPKEIEYFNSTMYIEKVEYEDGFLSIYIRGNDKVSHASSSILDEKREGSGGMYTDYEKGHDVYSFDFEVERKDNYIFSLQMVMKYEIPINIKVNIEN